MHFVNFIKLRKLSLPVLIGIVSLLTSCNHNGGENKPPQPDVFANGIYILNEGLLQMNNSTLSYYDFTENELTDDIFLDVNHRGLGDIGNDLQEYGSKLYCVVNNSGVVEILNKTNAKSIKSINLSGKQPRQVAFLHDKAYVTCFDGDLVRIDTASLEIEASIKTGLNPDGICVCNGKIYVANSGGLNFPNYDNKISVVDPTSFSVIKNIEVVINPTRIKSDLNGNVYVVSCGNYNNIPYTFQKISSITDEVVKVYEGLEVLNFDIFGNLAYIYSFNFSNNASWIKVLDLSTDEIVKENFISDGTTLKAPYGIKVNQLNGDVYITDAHNFTVNGDVYCFDKDGRKKFSFQAGLNPSAMVFNINPEQLTKK